MRRTFKQIQQLDVDWPRLFCPTLVAFLVLVALFQWSGHNPWVAVGGIVVIATVVSPIPSRQLRRRIAKYEVRMTKQAPPK